LNLDSKLAGSQPDDQAYRRYATYDLLGLMKQIGVYR
jgi:hypothetical protein